MNAMTVAGVSRWMAEVKICKRAGRVFVQGELVGRRAKIDDWLKQAREYMTTAYRVIVIKKN